MYEAEDVKKKIENKGLDLASRHTFPLTDIMPVFLILWMNSKDENN